MRKFIILLFVTFISTAHASDLEELGKQMTYFYKAATQEKFMKFQNLAEKNKDIILSKGNVKILVAVMLARVSEKNKWQIQDGIFSKLTNEILDKNSKIAKYINDDSIVDPAKLDIWWASFFATGEEKYLEKLFEYVGKDIEQKENTKYMLIYGAANWSFKANCRQHEKVKNFAQGKLKKGKFSDYKTNYLKECIAYNMRKTLNKRLHPKSNSADVQKTSPSSHQNEDGWRQNGKLVPDSDNIKSKNGFGAQLWIINDKSFFDNWNKPEPPKVPITKTAKRNKPVFIIFLFINPGLDQKSKANVTADVTIKTPNGKIYGSFKDIEIWQRIYKAPLNNIQLAIEHLGVNIEDDEQLGIYKVEVKIKDKIKNITLELKTNFTAQEK